MFNTKINCLSYHYYLNQKLNLIEFKNYKNRISLRKYIFLIMEFVTLTPIRTHRTL